MDSINAPRTSVLYGIAKKHEGSIEAMDVVRFFATFLQELRDMTEDGLLSCEGDVGDEVWTLTDKGREELRKSASLLDIARMEQRDKR